MNEVLLRTPKFNVERRDFDVPQRGKIRREVVVHPGAVLVVPVLEAGRVVMIRNQRYSVDRELLELPAGTLEPPEPPQACAARELEEETGYRAAVIEPLCGFYTSPGFSDERMHVFVARELTQTQQNLQGGEQIRVEIMPLSDAIRACGDGRIEDGKTIAALLVYHLRQRGV